MKKIIFLLIILILPISVLASNITSDSKIYINDNSNSKLTDNNENSYITIKSSDELKIISEKNIYGLYIIYELNSTTGVISNQEKNAKIGENGFLHEYININTLIGNSKEVVINYDNDVKISEIYVLDDGKLPKYVEVWEKPLDNNTDLLLFSTHSDDEQLFFLGLLPTYVARGANVQVVYYVNHYDNPKRLHEQLHGLYTVGIRNYPIIGIIPDAYSETLNGAIKNMEKKGLTVDDAINFQVEMLRRFKPSVVVGHDELGEYSHGQHILNTHTLKIALEKSLDETYDIDSFNKYGTWDVLKTYLHLYKENQIVMDYDTPLDYFNGKTAYEVSKEGYSKHNSQQWTWFTKWINGSNNEYTKSTDIKTYSPNEFGLYKSKVGEDINKNDMLENITLRKDQVLEEDTNTFEEIVDNLVDTDKDYINEYKYLFIFGISFMLIVTLYLAYKKKKSNK